jgi:hypothetical protein
VLPQAPGLLGSMQIAQTVTDTPKKQDIYIFRVCCEGDKQNFLLQPPGAMDEEIQPFDNIAVINRESSTVLSQIASYCTFEASCLIEPWTSIAGRATTIEKDTCVLVDIVIYGHQDHCEEVGDILNTRKVYLQEPDYRDMRWSYRNPHFMDLSSIHPGTNMDFDPLRSPPLQTDDVGSQKLQASNEKIRPRHF